MYMFITFLFPTMTDSILFAALDRCGRCVQQEEKQDQGSKAPSIDHHNSYFMTRLDYIGVED